MAVSPYQTRHDRDAQLPLHRHGEAYAALVLDGEYLEFGPDGPLRCGPGSLLLHPPFHAHGNRFGRWGARVLNVALPALTPLATLQARQVSDLREARELLERAPAPLPLLLKHADALPRPALPDWQLALAQALADSDEPLTQIVHRLGVSLAHASRSMRSAYGLSPQALRREWRWRRALPLLAGTTPLAEVAAGAGFADQSHFTRTTRLCAGMAPGALRRHINCVQDAA